MALQLFSNEFLTIDIGFKYIKIAKVRKNKNNDLTILNYGIGDTPKGCIKNGAINNQDAVIDKISKIIADNYLNAKEAKIVISGTNIITRIILVDKITDTDRDKRVWAEIHANLPINLDEHEVDFKVLDNVIVDNVEKTKIFVTAVPKKIIGSYIDILKKLGLKPLAVDIPANSVSKFFQKDIIFDGIKPGLSGSTYISQSDAVAVLDMGSETTIVNILKNKIPEFNRVILMGSSNIDAAIVKALDLSPGEEEKAERYKKFYGMVQKADPSNDFEWQCSEAVKSVVNQIVRQVKMCFDFYIKRCTGEKVSRIYLIGGGSQLKGITELFEEVFESPTYQIKVMEIGGIKFADNLNTEKINYLINALGIAL